MIETKYLIMIGAVICLLIIYYLYDEISNVKKIVAPVYQKTMELEAKVLELEKKNLENVTIKPIIQRNDSPALSITYRSDMVKNGNLSVQYADLSEMEANELLKNMEQNKSKSTQPNNKNLQRRELSDFVTLSDDAKNKKSNSNDLFNEETDTFDVKITGLTNKNPLEMVNLEQNDPVFLTNNVRKADTAEYQQILNGLTANMRNITSEDVFDDELDKDIIRSISESIQYADLSSDTIISDIPIINKKKSTIVNKKQIPIKTSVPVPKKQISSKTNVPVTKKPINKKPVQNLKKK